MPNNNNNNNINTPKTPNPPVVDVRGRKDYNDFQSCLYGKEFEDHVRKNITTYSNFFGRCFLQPTHQDTLHTSI